MKIREKILGFPLVRMKGLEPPRLAAPDPKSGSATNYDTCALLLFKNESELEAAKIRKFPEV